MPHLNIYVDEPSAKVIAKAAKREALSLSKWARGKLLAAAGAPEWPADYSAVIGSIHDENFVAPAESPLGQDQAVRFE